MPELIAGTLSLLTSTLLYRKRYTSTLKVGGLYLVQLWYLISTVLVVALFINLGLDIHSRSTYINFPLSSNLIFNLYILCLIVAAMGSGIHSTSTSVYQAFKNKGLGQRSAYLTNEKFHGVLSHNMVYLGGLIATALMGLLELNHPYFGPSYNFVFLIAFGILFGGAVAFGVLWSAHIGYTLVASFLSSIILGLFFRFYATNINSYPIAIVSLTSILTLFSLLLLVCTIFLASGRLSQKVINRTFPKGHPFHEALNLKVLRIKIEREWF